MTDEAMSPLRRRMIEDMMIRKFAPKTQHDYEQRVGNFAVFLGRLPGEDAPQAKPADAADDNDPHSCPHCDGRAGERE